ncbi:Glioma pathoproteinsis- protein 1 [Bulinus truncatus]|nr:Glioma pathoproteinsis- protein 1 [Bulinus truncatus]
MSVNISVDSGMTDDFRQLALRLHNDYRRDEKMAADMNRLDWSYYLEQQAALWVQQCNFKHQTDPPWGENLYRSTFMTASEYTMDAAILAWKLESNNVLLTEDGKIDCCSQNKQTCCHFTQLVWAQTEFLGCALTFCPVLKGEITLDDLDNAYFFVCYYYPPGNVLTEQPYQRSPKGQCSLCSPTNPDCDRGLCYFETSRC